MKAPLINIKNLHISIGTFTKADSAGLLSGPGAFYEEALKNGVMPLIEPPAIGEYWAGQGGIYAGIQQDEDGQQYHKIFGTEDVGRFAWGEYGTETTATSKVNGLLNTCALRDFRESFPAAEAASNYTADGHHDFVLPSAAELFHAWTFIPDSFAKESYWSSTQRSAYDAYYMDFEDGWLSNNAKYDERLARPVRRILR